MECAAGRERAVDEHDLLEAETDLEAVGGEETAAQLLELRVGHRLRMGERIGSVFRTERRRSPHDQHAGTGECGELPCLGYIELRGTGVTLVAYHEDDTGPGAGGPRARRGAGPGRRSAEGD